MIHYHGSPFGGPRDEVQRFVSGRHIFVPWKRHEDLPVVADCAQSFAIDNSAFTFWRNGQTPAWDEYYTWVEPWLKHPACDWAVIPDIVDGSEDDNDKMIDEWPFESHNGVPVWHLHESLDRLEMLVKSWPRVGIGSSGQFASIGTDNWWMRMGDAMRRCCDSLGRPLSKLHGFRMLDPAVFQRFPFSSADSTNVARNASTLDRFGMYCPPTRSQRAEAIACRIESVQSPAVWTANAIQCRQSLF
jgi:hypothetical protein